MLVDAGADALMIRSSWLGLHVPGFLPDYLFFPEAQVPLDKMPPQYYAKELGKGAIRLMTEEAKKRFDVPVILIGYVTPELGEQMLEEGKADFIGMNRPLICDTELPQQAGGRPARGYRALHPLRHLPRPERSRSCATAASTPRWASAATGFPRPTRRRRSSSWAAARPAWRRPGWRRCAGTT